MARVSAERAEEQTKSDDETIRAGGGRRPLQRGLVPQPGPAPSRTCKAGSTKALEALGYDRRDRRRPRQARRAGQEVGLQDRGPGRAGSRRTCSPSGKLRDDERLIVFTEYKETLFYLEQRLLQEGFDKNTLRLLYGGMNADEFEAVKSRV